jgi:hypothetical protein
MSSDGLVYGEWRRGLAMVGNVRSNRELRGMPHSSEAFVEGWGLRRRTEGLWDPIVFEKKGRGHKWNRL